MNPEEQSRIRGIYLGDINSRKVDIRVRNRVPILFKGAKYAFFVFVAATFSGIIWYFISGQYLDPQRIIGTGIYANNPASTTYGSIVAYSVLSIVSFVFWKFVSPRIQEVVARMNEEAGKEIEVLEKMLEEKEGNS